MTDVHSLLLQAADGRDWRPGTVRTYHGALKRIGVVDDSLTRDELQSRVLSLDNINARRTAAIAVRAVLGVKVRIPRGNPARYDLPSEDALRFALMLSKHEARALLAMYAGLRLGELCAATRAALDGDRLRVDRQVRELKTQPGYPRRIFLAPPKGNEREVILPTWLISRVAELEETVTPSVVYDNLVRAGRRAGLKLNVHMLRHWYATESLNRGMSVQALSKQLGHGTVAVTVNTYLQFRDAEIHDTWG